MPEVRRLLLGLTEPPERAPFRLAWSTFRRRHQAIAKRCHTARRLRQHPAPTRAPLLQALRAPALDRTDERWARVSSVLPPQKPPTGRPANDHRTLLAGMLWVAQTGAGWRDLPAHFGPWETVYSRYRRWRRVGIWQRVLDTLQGDHDATP